MELISIASKFMATEQLVAIFAFAPASKLALSWVLVSLQLAGSYQAARDSSRADNVRASDINELRVIRHTPPFACGQGAIPVAAERLA